MGFYDADGNYHNHEGMHDNINDGQSIGFYYAFWGIWNCQIPVALEAEWERVS